MKSRHLLSALALGLGLTVVLLLLLTRPTPVARADPGIYYVREGASGDCLSVTTPCSNVQYAINLAIASGEVWVATGTYTENLVITHGLSLRGGWNVSFTVQAPATYPTTIDGRGAHVISATVESGSASIGGFTIRNGRDGVHICSGVFTLTHNLVYSMAVQGIEVTTGTVWIEGNTINDTDEEGIRISGGTAVLSANLVYDTGRDGIHTGDLSAHVEIRGNTVYSTARDGIDGRGHKVIIASNTIYDTGRDGVHVEDAGTAHVQHNIVYSTTDHGIYARDVVSLTTIADNTVHNTGYDGDGIYVRGGDFTIIDNTVYDTGSDGIHTHQSSANVEIQGNTVYDIGDDGIDARGATVTVANNAISACADNGIKAEEAGYTFINANQVYGDGDAGIDLDDAGTFTVTNNVVAGSSVASILIQTSAGPHNFLYHNTLVGSAAGQQGTGISVTVPGITIALVNNIVVSHNVGITATPGATLIVSHTLLWGNGSDPISGTGVLPGPPRFVAPAQQDYHLLPGSPAVDAGIDVGVTSDVDGDRRPIGALPDVGADEVRLRVFLPLVLHD
jgi:hypothetical protein